MEGIQVIKQGFDILENHNPYLEELLGTFVGDGQVTAHGKAARFVENMPAEKHYVGYNGQVYPKFVFRKIDVT